MHTATNHSAATATLLAALLARPLPGDIDQRLADILADWAARPFAWGVADCCQFVADAANRLYGLRLDYGYYHTEFGAARLLHRLGQLPTALAHAGFAPLPNVREAQRGDVVIWQQNKPAKAQPTSAQPTAAERRAVPLDDLQGLFSHGLALCAGAQVLAKSADGLLPIAPAQWRSAWRFVGTAQPTNHHPTTAHA